jgi:GTPase SAR1 family protein
LNSYVVNEGRVSGGSSCILACILLRRYDKTRKGRDQTRPDETMAQSLEAKIVVLGAQGVGKTSLVHRYVSTEGSEYPQNCMS